MRAVRVKEEAAGARRGAGSRSGSRAGARRASRAGLCPRTASSQRPPRSTAAGHSPSANEVAGWVEAIGPGVQWCREGDAVSGPLLVGCGQCPACRRGSERFCPNTSNRVGPGWVTTAATRLRARPQRPARPALGDLDPSMPARWPYAALTPSHPMRTRRDSLGPGSVQWSSVSVGSGTWRCSSSER